MSWRDTADKWTRTQSDISSKEETLAFETRRKYIEGDDGMKDLFEPFGCSDNRIENGVLNKQK